ncbi:MAG: hypothetical protein ACYS5V_04760 [Planctomycetota bacterium]|jgi:hypothetical protein
MPQRIAAIGIAVLGVVAVAVFALLGRNLYRAARTGPAWRRRVLTAGLFVLAGLGLSACGDSSEPDDDKIVIVAGQPLQQTDAWKQLTATWKEAREIADGKRGGYPFTRAGKDRMLARMCRAGRQIDALCDAALLDPTESALLLAELDVLTGRVNRFRTWENRLATCYVAGRISPAESSMERLTARLPLLKELAGRQTLKREVMEKVLKTIEADLETLGKQDLVKLLPADQRARAGELRRETQTHLDGIRKLLEAGE